MAKKIFSCCLNGLNCQLVEVEADISNGLPMFSIVGLGDTSVQESKERVRSSIKNSGVTFPPTRKTVNLAPAQIKKQGALFDLPIAISVLLAGEQIKSENFEQSVIVGELSLDGSVKKIQGALAIAQHVKEKGFKRIFLPAVNAKEASFIPGIDIYAVKHLKELIFFAGNRDYLKPYPNSSLDRIQQSLKYNPEYSLDRILGLDEAKRALCVAAAGGHNFLLIGPPGTGKTILARAFADLVPAMSQKEIFETTKIFSIAGMLEDKSPLITKRPFREVHHTASLVSVIGGGGINPRPGEISLAHNGVLFFDEITEFPAETLEALRQPLEDKYININRAKFSVKFPSNFIFVGTMNPCPCGYHGDPKIKCICSPYNVKNYHKKISGPILDRFDIILQVPLIPIRNIFNQRETGETQKFLQAINNAQTRQNNRFQDSPGIAKNADMTINEIRRHCNLSKADEKYLNQASESHHFSNRVYLKMLKIARTIADLDQSPEIEFQHLSEALHYRPKGIQT